MKNCFPTTILMLICILAAAFSANAQLYEVSLDEKIQKSSLIVEGRVVAQESYLASDGRVYTANKVAVSALLKGELPTEILTVTTWGGKTENGVSSWTHMLTLQPGEEGIFFLERSRVPETWNTDFPSPSFDVYSSSQGFLKFTRNGNGAWLAYEPFHIYTNIKDEVYDFVAVKVGHTHSVIDATRSMLHRSGIRYFFKTTSISGSTVNFEIIVNSLYGSKQLYNAGAALNYNPDFFGSNIATNGNLQLQANGISANTVYSLTKSNLTSSKVKIELSTTGSVSSLSTLTTSEQTLAKGSLTIVNPFVDPGISFSIAEMYALSKFWEGGSAYEFDTIIVEIDLNPHTGCDPPVIESFEPECVRAGTDDVLTIRGTCFGDSSAFRSVDFTNSKTGPEPIIWVDPHANTEILTWSDTLIRVMVPSRVVDFNDFSITHSVGSGYIRVNKGYLEGRDTSEVPLCVIFSVLNDIRLIPGTTKVVSNPVWLGNYNGMGGQSLVYTPEFKSYPGATAAFERALISWRCATGINYIIQDESEVDLSVAGIIGFVDLPDGVGGATLNTIPDFFPCDSLGIPVGANRKNFSIAFNKNIIWHTDTLMPELDLTNPVDTADLESTALHELGHAHLLQHSNDSTDLMFYRRPYNQEYRREITPNSLAGGLYVMDISVNAASDSCQAKMEKVSGDCTKVTDVIEISPTIQIGIKLFPNPAQSILNVTLDFRDRTHVPLNWTLFDPQGQKMLSGFLNQSTSISLNSIPSGVYFFMVGTENEPVKAFKVVKQ